MLLVKDVIIITQNEKREIIRGNIAIKGNKIVGVGKVKVDEEAEVIDGRGLVALPGFINTHTHIAMTIFRGYGEGLPLKEWLEKKIWPAEARLRDEDLYWGAKLGIAESFLSGITTFVDMYIKDVNFIGKAAKDSGARAFISLGLIDFAGGIDEQIRKTERIIRKWWEDELVTPHVSCHAPYTCSKGLILAGKELAKKEGLIFHMHVAETRREVFDILSKEGKRPVEYLDALGVLDEKTILAHASWVTKREINIIAKRNSSISHNPISNLKLATGGICPVLEYVDYGANVTLGTDGTASNNSLNMFETIKMASLLQKHSHWDALAISPQQALDMATVNAAKALNLNAGSISPGKLADIVLLRLTPNLRPIHNIVANIVYSANPSNVEYVIVNGRTVVRKGELLTMDMEEVIKKVERIKDRVCL